MKPSVHHDFSMKNWGWKLSGETWITWRLEHGEEGPTESTKIFVNLMSSLRLSFGRRDVEPTKNTGPYYVSLDEGWFIGILINKDPY